MNEILKTSEILGTVELAEGECELRAVATAEYHEVSNRLNVHLGASLQRRHAVSGQGEISADWLPKNQHVSEMTAIDEAGEVARDIFRRWVLKVRESAPCLHQHNYS